MSDLWDKPKAMQRGKLIALSAYIRKEKSQINNLSLILRI